MRGIKQIFSKLSVIIIGLITVFIPILQLSSVPVLAADIQYNLLTPGSFSVVADSGCSVSGNNIHFDGYNNAQLRMHLSSSIDLTKYTNLNAVVKFTSAAPVSSSQVILQLYDSSWTGRSNSLTFPVNLNSSAQTVSIPLSVFSNSQFNSSNAKDLNFSVYIHGKFTADLNFSNFSLTGLSSPTPTPTPVPTPTSTPVTTPTTTPTSTPIVTTTPTITPVLQTGHTDYSIFPATDIVTADSGITYQYQNSSKSVFIHLLGYNNGEIRFRFPVSLDLTKYTDLVMSTKFSSTGNNFGVNPITLQFYDSSWTGRSGIVNLPVVLNGAEKQIDIPISLLLKSGFNAHDAKDLDFQIYGQGQFSADLQLNNVGLYSPTVVVSTPPPTSTPTPVPVPTPVPIPTFTPVPIPTPTPTPTPTTTPAPSPASCNSTQFYFGGACVNPPTTLSNGAAIAGVTSNQVLTYWQTVPNTVKVNIYLAAEPKDPASTSVSMPGEILYAIPPATNNFYYLNNLAPAADDFIRIEIITQTGVVNRYLHAKTLGGPRAKLNTAVREIHAYAPNVLQVVVADGTGWQGKDANGKDVFNRPANIGTALQTGTWTITRADGTTISVKAVYRHSVPVSANDYTDMGAYTDNGSSYKNFFQIQSDNVTSIDHRIYLVLNQNIGSRDVLKITGPNGISFTLPFSDKYLETPVVQLNQVGYNPAATERYAYVSGWLGDGGALSLANFPGMAQVLSEAVDPNLPRTVAVNSLAITPRANCATCTLTDSDIPGIEVRQVDLSSVPASETNYYRLRIPGVGVSWQTEVSNRAAFRAYYVMNRGLFFERWGGDLQATYTAWSRPQDHTGSVYTGNLLEFANGSDTYYPDTTPRTNPIQVIGGYHDAGDFDQRPMHTAVAQLLLRAFELNPTKYTDGQLNIPESGNGIPDLLDQALWGIKGWSALQDLSDGGVRMGIQSASQPHGYYLSSQDQLTWWTFGKDAKITARAAGLFAQASRLVAPYNAATASDLKSRAIKAYNYAVQHYDSSVAADLLYGSGELYKLTGDVQYKTEFETLWSQIDANVKTMYGNVAWNTPFELVAWNLIQQANYAKGDYFTPDFFTAYYTSGGATPAIKDLMTSKMSGRVDQILSDIQNSHAHRNARPQGYPQDWGASTAVSKFLDPMLSYMQMTGTQTQTEINALSLSMDYTLGGNPDGVSFITGLGSRRPEEPLHIDSLAFERLGNLNGVKAPMPGIPSYGSVDGVGGASYYQPTLNAFYPAFTAQPKSYRYTDTRPFVMSSEFDVWQEQAPLVEAVSILVGSNASPTALNGSDDCGIDHCMDLGRYK